VDMACGSSVVFDWRQTTRTHLAMSIFYFQRLLRYAFAGRPQKKGSVISENANVPAGFPGWMLKRKEVIEDRKWAVVP